MVQDTSASPEMYLSKLKGDKCGGWGITDEEYTDTDYSYDDLKECTVVWAVSVPGGNEWCSEDGGSESEKRHQASQPLKYPIPNAPHIGVQIKVNTLLTYLFFGLNMVAGLRYGCRRHAQIDGPKDICRDPLFRTVCSLPLPLLFTTNFKLYQRSLRTRPRLPP